MEKKKIVLIAVIIGLFFFIALALPLSLLSTSPGVPSVSGVPKPSAPEPPPAAPASMDVREPVVNPPPTNVIINTYDENGDIANSQTVPGADGSLTINLMPATRQEPAESASKPASSGTASSAPAKPAETAKPAASAPASSAPAQTKPASSAPAKPAASSSSGGSSAPRAAAGYDYWVQSGSFTTEARAESAQKTLSGEGIPKTVVVTATVEGQKRFRVRSGPYLTKNEAESWLRLIKEMDGFGESYVSQTAKQ
jgi:DedD protein